MSADGNGRKVFYYPNAFSEEAILYDLPGALQAFRNGGALGDGGRSGMIRALAVATNLLVSRTSDASLTEPLLVLQGALADLEKGALHPALTPQRQGRPQARQDVMQFKSACLVASDLLHHSDRDQWPRELADGEIFRRLTQAAKRLGVVVTRKSSGNLATRCPQGSKGYYYQSAVICLLGPHDPLSRRGAAASRPCP